MRIPSLRGFTLIETLVAVSLFSVLMVMTIGSLTVLIDANRKARSEKSVINNVNAALEIMARSIREGTDYELSNTDCPDADYCAITFTASNNDTVTYRVADNTIERSVNSGAFTPITAPDVSIEKLAFTAVADDAATEVPKVQIAVKAKTEGAENTAAEFNVQTSVSQRFAFDVPVLATGEYTCGNSVCDFYYNEGTSAYVRETNSNCSADCAYDNAATCPLVGDGICGKGEADTAGGGKVQSSDCTATEQCANMGEDLTCS